MIESDTPLEKPSDPPNPILEPLPSGLKYAFLRSNETSPVVIPSSLAKQ